MKPISQLQFFKRVARHQPKRKPKKVVKPITGFVGGGYFGEPEVEHTFADDQAERLREDNSIKVSAIVYLLVAFLSHL